MTQETLDIIHNSYQTALEKSSDILEVVETLYSILEATEVDSVDTNAFDAFVDGLRACFKTRRRTFEFTNLTVYLTQTIMYIIVWLNEVEHLGLDLNLYSRRKSLESNLTKILRKSSDPNCSVNIRDVFGIRGIILNDCTHEEADNYIHLIFNAVSGILSAKSRKMRKEFIDWLCNNSHINSLDRNILNYILTVPFKTEFVKDFVREPKCNTYQSLHFTLSIPVYSSVLAGCQIEVQLRSAEMHEVAEHGEAAHDEYKKYRLEGSAEEDPVTKVFLAEDFSNINIIGFSNYDSPEKDIDGLHVPKVFGVRRVSPTLVPKNI